ncbi:aldolase/citrate lyase family protein, partial [Mycolicibacterium porcinum]|uniref:aldolase/citrate lyase family protein n=1 Tax=Mycolicibacterium porcinum TaxID=39693 RepID=UPI00256ED52E
MENTYRPRRTCLSVPGSSLKMIEKAKSLPADEVFLDLEDAVAPGAKESARAQVAAALADDGWAGQLRGVRVNDWTTPWTYADVIEVVAGAGGQLDLIVLPKVTEASHVQALDLLLTHHPAVPAAPAELGPGRGWHLPRESRGQPRSGGD